MQILDEYMFPVVIDTIKMQLLQQRNRKIKELEKKIAVIYDYSIQHRVSILSLHLNSALD